MHYNSLRGLTRYEGYTQNQEVDLLERNVAKYAGSNYCLMFRSYEDALKTAMLGCGIRRGDKVFCSLLDSAPVISAILALECFPVFIDVDKGSLNLSPRAFESAVTKYIDEDEKAPKIAVITNAFGLPADFAAINEVAALYGINIIEDLRCGFGGQYRAQKAGSFGRYSAASFFYSTSGSILGEEGALFCHNSPDTEKAKIFRQSFIEKQKGIENYAGYHHFDVQATIISEILRRDKSAFKAKLKVLSQYRRLLSPFVQLQEIPEGYVSGCTALPIVFADKKARDNATDLLNSKKYIYTIYNTKFYKDCLSFGSFKFLTPAGENICERVLALPLHPYLNENTVDYLCSLIIKAL